MGTGNLFILKLLPYTKNGTSKSQICNKEELDDLYNQQYKEIVVPLSLHSVANYTVQTLLENISSRALALDMCSKIVPVFEDLLAESITGSYCRDLELG